MGVMYELRDGEWFEYARKEGKNTHCAHCGDEYGRYEGGTVVHGGPEDFEFQKPTVCWDCYMQHFTRHAPHPLNYYQLGWPHKDAV